LLRSEGRSTRASRPISRVLCSVHGGVVTIYLAPRLPPGSSSQPGASQALIAPYLALLLMGFARHRCLHRSGELLPHHFTLARSPMPRGRWRYVSVALSVGSPLLGVTQHPAWWSSDFPLFRGLAPEQRSPGLLARSLAYNKDRSAAIRASTGKHGRHFIQGKISPFGRLPG